MILEAHSGRRGARAAGSGFTMWIVMLLALCLAVLIQLALPPLGRHQAKAPVLLSVVLYYALRHNVRVMLWAALLAGMLQDALSPIPLGYSTVCFAAAGWLGSGLHGLIMTDSVLTRAMTGAAAGAGVTLLLYALLVRTPLLAGLPPGDVLLKAWTVSLLGLLVTPAVFAFVGSLDRMVGNVECREELDELD